MSKTMSLGGLSPSKLLTATDVAAQLNVSLRTVRRLIADGSLKITRIGRSVRIAPAALSALVTGGAR